MGYICLSSPTVLRCQSFTTVQSVVLVIPAGLEALVASWTVYANWGLGHRKHMLLAAEGCVYLALALLDMITHLLPAIRDDIRAFRVVDTIVGVASVFPIFFYGLFIFFLLRSQFIDSYPRWLKLLIQISLIAVLLPITLILYEVASFVGITRGAFTNGSATIVAIGFQNDRDEGLWTVFTYSALALLAAMQALPACFALKHLLHVNRDHKQIQSSANGTFHSFGGTIWTTTGLIIGLIETLVGYAPPSFATVLTRRILRALSRAKLCVGASLGMESVETFDDARQGQGLRRSKLLQLIANPRLSTFRELSPTATTFHAAARAPEKPISQPVTSLGLPGMRGFANLRGDVPAGARERVTVYWGGARAPTLHVRFSELNMPSPSLITERFRSPSPEVSEVGSTWRPTSDWSILTGPPLRRNSVAGSSMAADDGVGGMHAHSKSQASMPDSFRAVQELTPHFPPLPDISQWKMPVYAHGRTYSKASARSPRSGSNWTHSRSGSSISYPSAVGGRLPSEIDSAEAADVPASDMRPISMYYFSAAHRHRRNTTGDTTRTPRAYHGRGDTVSELDSRPATPNSDGANSTYAWGARIQRTMSPESWRDTTELGNDSWASRRWVPSGVIDGRSRWASWQPEAKPAKTPTPPPLVRNDTGEAMRIPWLRDLNEVEQDEVECVSERRMYLAPAPSVQSLTEEGSGALKLSRGPTPRTPTPAHEMRETLESTYVERWSRAPTDVGIDLGTSYDSHVLGRMGVVSS
ncbi:hypothetical protein BD626DRAFT_103641 [Schizophyllum amplum]|uniref:Uncharacterized protein n=1 Tax=Schizophyllum amplum TaxID=97359 RepID=A0A550CS50_9AGAR|nr:hypothetical protein BD626DRAFT_103641 [Auriculariopsis ampla]